MYYFHSFKIALFPPLSEGAAGRGSGVPQVIHQSSVEVSFERSEEGEDHAVQSHSAGWLRLHAQRGGESLHLLVFSLLWSGGSFSTFCYGLIM